VKQPDTNPLRKELARSQQAASHPDSDVLTAFAEGSLLARERESVLEHLASCAQCREELSLATETQPELVAEAKPLPLPRPARPPLRSWLPWVAVAAGVLIISSTLLLREQRKPGGETRSDGSRGVPTKEIAQAPAQPSQLPTPSELKPATAPHETSASVGRSAPPRRPQESSTTAVASAAPAPSAPLQEQSAQAVSVQPSIANSDDNLVTSSRALGANRTASTGARAGSSSAVLTKDQSNPDQLARAKATPTTSQVLDVQGAASAGSNAGFNTGFAATSSAPAMRKAPNAGATRPHWRINDLGQLERSFGDGSWKSVPMSESSRLHMISVFGSEVWAGGENLRLEHSSDNGNTWQSVKLPPKSGYNHAVTHIRFPTPQEGIVDSDDGNSWHTTDGGQTWK